MGIKKRVKKIDKRLHELVNTFDTHDMTLETEIKVSSIEKILNDVSKLKVDIALILKDNEDLKDYYEGIDRERKMELAAMKQNYDIATQPSMIRNIRGTAE